MLRLIVSSMVMTHVSPRRKVPGVFFWTAVDREVDVFAEWWVPDGPRAEGQRQANLRPEPAPLPSKQKKLAVPPECAG